VPRTEYRQLQPEERQTLASLQQQGYSLRAIAKTLGRSASSLSRERRRNVSTPDQAYVAADAQAASLSRRRQGRPWAKLHPEHKLWHVVKTCLSWHWSPQQIARTLRRMWPNEPDMQVSHETIYTAIYAHAGGELRRQLIACLRQGKSTRKPRSAGTDRRGQIPDMVSIHVRPPEVEDRVMPGHWEGDLIKGAENKSAVAVLVERRTRLVLLAKMADATAASALEAFSAKLNSIAEPLRQTLTYDQGKEMSRHKQLAQRTGMKVYFCDPHSPWQRGSCENTNGLLRQYMPKGTDLSVFSQDELDAIADQMNNRPRATHDWRSPIQVFAEILAAQAQVAASTIH
jgi:transposase, IS30 family